MGLFLFFSGLILLLWLWEQLVLFGSFSMIGRIRWRRRGVATAGRKVEHPEKDEERPTSYQEDLEGGSDKEPGIAQRVHWFTVKERGAKECLGVGKEQRPSEGWNGDLRSRVAGTVPGGIVVGGSIVGTAANVDHGGWMLWVGLEDESEMCEFVSGRVHTGCMCILCSF